MFKLTLVTPDRKLIADEEIEAISLPGYLGELNLLPGHAPLVTALGAGVVRFKLKATSDEKKVAVGWGYCQVNPHGVYVLAESAVFREDIETKVVLEKLKSEESKLTTETLSDVDWDKAQREIQRLKSELDLAQG